MKRKQKKLALHQKIHHNFRKHFHRHVHKVLHFSNHLHHHLLHVGELMTIVVFTIFSGSMLFANLTGYSEELYRNNSTEVSQALVDAMKNPGASLKQGNIISIWTMDLNIENTFTKGYCTYGAARISPEFFPYIDSMTQQRTRGGNAVDWCKNAAETGYKIGTTPAQGALIIYDAGGKFGPYGHVGKVMHYDSSLKKIIVRDMAWIARGIMSDRWEDLTTAQVKCYIYNKTATPTTPTNSTTPTIPTIPTVNTGIISTVNTGATPTIPTTPTTPTTPVIPTNLTTPTKPTTPTTPSITPQDTINKQLLLNLEHLSDIAQHFLTQNDITITYLTNSPLNFGETATITLKIKNKKTGEKYTGLLPFAFTVLSTNDTLQPNISNIKLVNDGKVDISVLGQKIGKSTIVIIMDGTKIGEFSLEVK